MQIKQLDNGDYYLVRNSYGRTWFLAKKQLCVNYIALPKHLWGKKVRIKIEIIGDEL